MQSTDTQTNKVDEWIEVGELEEIPRQGARVVDTHQGNIAVFRTLEDEVFALHDQCPHQGGPLSQGMVYGKRVACPLHDWRIELETGVAVAPDEGCTTKFPVRLESGKVFVKLMQS
jgi:nitrite reductase (NADH) small subunit